MLLFVKIDSSITFLYVEIWLASIFTREDWGILSNNSAGYFLASVSICFRARVEESWNAEKSSSAIEASEIIKTPPTETILRRRVLMTTFFRTLVVPTWRSCLPFSREDEKRRCSSPSRTCSCVAMGREGSDSKIVGVVRGCFGVANI